MTTIAELAEDRTVEGVFAVTKKERRRTRNGAPYLALELADASGRVEARVWNDVELLDRRFGEGEAYGDLDGALRALAAETYGRPAAIAYRRGYVEVVRGPEGELDTELVDRHGLSGIAYTARRGEAMAAVDSGSADVAYLLREPRVEDVFAVALRGERMPQKSTYFFPKPLSGLLFHPLDP